MAFSFPSGMVWFRRDLRSHDHAALYHALRQCQQVYCVFVLDREILDGLPRADMRVEFIRESLVELDAALRALSGHPHGGLIVRHAVARAEIPALARQLGVATVFTNHDDEPLALERDAHVRSALAAHGQKLLTFKDHTVFERGEILTQSGTPYSVFTPYKNAWLRKIDAFYLRAYPVERHAAQLAPRPKALRQPVPALPDLGFDATSLSRQPLPTGMQGAQRLLNGFLTRIDRYDRARDYPAVKGPSYLGVHLRFGTLSPRQTARLAHERSSQGSAGAATWLSELIWRDFYFQILAHHPHVADASFKPAYDAIAWEEGAHADALFAAWREGRTGYPLIDAAMAQINQTGYMHNRLRMVVASFLVKDLGIDWRRGERYFAEKLNDFDLSANNGGWQWASSSGCDAQPYFRIFNPESQSRKFDPDGQFIRRYLPQLAKLSNAALHAPWKARPLELQEANVVLGQTYPHPVIDHDIARQRTLERYAVVKPAP